MLKQTTGGRLSLYMFLAVGGFFRDRCFVPEKCLWW
jgi:hypothetical protein